MFQLRELTDDVPVGVPAESHLQTMFQLVFQLRELTDDVLVGVPINHLPMMCQLVFQLTTYR